MLTGWDYLVIGVYLVFMMGIGFLWSRINKNSSDYFRGGGNVLWWINGMSSLAAGMTAYSFTAAGAKVFETGFLLFIIYFVQAIPMLLVYFYFSGRFRQMRVITICDAIRRRFGKSTEQFWVWTALPLGLFNGGVMIYIVSLFVSAAIGLPIIPTILILTTVVTVLAVAGGCWAILAGDFIQMMIVTVVSVTILIRSVLLPEVGGFSGFMSKIPECYTNFSLFERPAVWISLLTMFAVVNTLRAIDLNSVGAKFLKVKDGRHARKATLVMIIGMALTPLIAFTPVMVCKAIGLNLVEMFPNLSNANEGAYVAIAHHVLPQGMVGLMVCAIFATTLASLDVALNNNAGFFVKNFYNDIINPNASEKTLVALGRFITAAFGVLIAGAAVLIATFRDVDLFSMLLKFNVLLQFPMIIPTVWGMIYRRTPGWTAWSTVLVSMAVAWVSQYHITAEQVASIMGIALPLNALEAKDLVFVGGGIVTLIAGTAWFFFTTLFYKETTPEFRSSVDSFFKDMAAPIDHVAENTVNQDAIQYRNMGMLCNIYGGAICAGFLIPNLLNNRMLFIYCGGAFVLLGLFLLCIHRRMQKKSCD